MSGPAEHQSKSQQQDEKPNDPKFAGLLALVARGFALHPLHNPIFTEGQPVRCSCGDPHTNKAHKIGKHPRSEHGCHDATHDEKQLAKWHAKWPDANWGIATGFRSGIFAVDEDAPGAADALRKLVPGGKLEATVLTGTGGHCYLTYAGNDIKTATGRRSGHLIELLDIRGEGGYVVAPGSVHPNGKVYTWRDEAAPIPAAPVELITALRRESTSTERQPTGSAAADTTLDQVRAALGALAPHRVANRDDWLAVGMAIKSVEPSDLGFEVWKDWSRGWDQFKEEEWRQGGEHHRNWARSMTPDGGLTAGTLFKLAAEDQENAGLIFADTVDVAAIDWLWYGRIAFGKIQGIIGLPDQGKDTILLDIAARLSRGAPFNDGRPSTRGEPRPTYYLSAEDALADTVLPRFLAAGGDRPYLATRKAFWRRGREEILTIEDEGLRVIGRDLDRMRAKFACGPGLIILSPFDAFMSGRVDSWKAGDIRRVLHPLARLVEHTGWALVVIAHLTKGGGDGALIHRVAGSQAFAAALRIAYLVGPDPNAEADGPETGRRVFVPMKRNLLPNDVTGLAFTVTGVPTPGLTNPSPEQTVPVVKWLGETTVTAEDVARGPTKGDDSAARYEAWLLKQFVQHGVAQLDGARVLTTARLEELCESAGLPWNSVRARLRPLGATPAREKDATTGKHAGTTWRLDEGDLF